MDNTNDLAQVMREVMDSRAVAVEEVNGIRFAVVPSGYKVHALTDLQFSPFAATPVRTKAHPVFTDAESLELYLDTFATPSTRMFASRERGVIVAKIDYHGKEAPAWCEHSATLALKHSDEWIAWKGQNKQQVSQETLAEFLEDHAPDIVDPSAARMLEIAETISVSANCLFDSKTNRANGQVRITFNTEGVCILSIEELPSSGACKWCALGAVYQVAGYPIMAGVAELNLASRELYGVRDATAVNDEIGHGAVLRVYDFVIHGMEEAE